MPVATNPTSAGQVAAVLAFVPLTVAWCYAEFLEYRKRTSTSKVHSDIQLVDLESGPEKDGEKDGLLDNQPVKGKPSTKTQLLKLLFLDEGFLMENRLILRAITEFGFHLLYFYICDRTNLFGESKKSYNRDLFIFLYLLLIIVSAMTSLKRHVERSVASGKSILYLNRHQTEEWKGWMQVLFLMYHYFAAGEIYNAIRIFIACYVWMTGFGNFSYYYVRKDFSLGRFAQMMWRLNFFVFFCCIVLNNSYMLYYICPMHTLFTVMVYASLGIFHKYNERPAVIAAKLAACFAVVIVVWEVSGVFGLLWSPFKFLVAYTDPRKPDLPVLHEWQFRSGLDRYVWIFGMICAYFHPTVERWLEKIEEHEPRRRVTLKGIITAVCLVVLYLWYEHVYCLDKISYNKLHPYTSWIPITVYIVLRNVCQPLREYSLALIGWLGKITLETYIGQFHIWLRTGVPNGQPGLLLQYFPDYPMLNFMFATSIYILISWRVFELTNTLKVAFVPSKDNGRLLSNALWAASIGAGIFAVALVLLNVPGILV